MVKNLEINERKRLVIDTRKSLLKLGKSIDLNLSNKSTKSYYSKVIDSILSFIIIKSTHHPINKKPHDVGFSFKIFYILVFNFFEILHNEHPT